MSAPFSPALIARAIHLRNPRERWMIGIKLKDSDGSQIVLDICPSCIPLFFPQADGGFFRSMEHTEEAIRNSVTREMVQSANNR